MSKKTYSFWDFKSYEEGDWFKKLIILLISLGVLYSILHILSDRLKPRVDYEYSILDKDQMQQINRIYFDSSLDTNTSPVVSTKINIDSSVKDTLLKPAGRRDSLDSISKLKTRDRPTSVTASTNNKSALLINDTCNCVDCTPSERVMCYLWNEFSHQLDTNQMRTIGQYLSSAKPIDATNFLSHVRLKVKSYFWLTGPLVYLEIIFWSWFGVICSVLFNLGIISKNRTTNPSDPTTYFDSSEVPSQIAKLLYAPVCTLAIILGYNFFNDPNLIDISSSKGLIVFAFIAGFYSSRLTSFLDKLKDLLLPGSSTDAAVANAAILRNIVVQLQLDETIKDFWDLLKTDTHLAEVTLQKENSTQKAVALNIDKNQWPLYIFDFVQPGTYTVSAIWTTKQDEETVNLKAEQKIEMKDADLSVTLKLVRIQ